MASAVISSTMAPLERLILAMNVGAPVDAAYNYKRQWQSVTVFKRATQMRRCRPDFETFNLLQTPADALSVQVLTIANWHTPPHQSLDHLHPPTSVLTTLVPWGGEYPPDPPSVDLGRQHCPSLTHARSMQLTRGRPSRPAAYHIGLPFRIDCAGVLSECISEHLTDASRMPGLHTYPPLRLRPLSPIVDL
ncbi:hypothetical protein NMY22_g785 [Coprinellus aureogranulatus]|nr:hypothetical protein NMY22_g785 [Coprinellus aureogranulatus]